jgi:cytochrome b subunit of formate dehydrogenase
VRALAKWWLNQIVSSETDTDGSTDGGYVHVPEGEAGGEAPTGEEPVADGFGRKGWALTAVLFTCVLVIPGIIYLYPYVAGWFGLPFFATYLALPLVPAVLLGLVAVWSMTAATRDR